MDTQPTASDKAPGLLKRWKLPGHLAALFIVAFNDNAAKAMLLGLAGYVLSTADAGRWQGIAAALFALPFVLFSPLAGWIADRFSKQRILWVFLAIQLVAVSLAWFTVGAGSFYWTLAVFFILAMQSAFYSPAKQGILKELVGSRRLGMAVGWMEMLTITAILIGMASGQLIDYTFRGEPRTDYWEGARVIIGFLWMTSLLSLLVFLPVPHTPPLSKRRFEAKIFWEHFGQLTRIWNDPRLRYSALGSAWFYSVGAFLSPVLFRMGHEIHGGATGSAAEGSSMMLTLGAGIAVGSLAAAGLSRKRIELGIVPIGAAGMALTLLLASGLPAPGWWMTANLTLMGFCGALFVVPLTAYFQDCAEDERRGDAIAGSNLLLNIGAFGAGLLFSLLAGEWNWPSRTCLLLAGILSLGVTGFVLYKLPAALLRLTGLVVVRILYRTTVRGSEHLPAAGGTLLICNHISYADAVLLQYACPRPPRFMAHSNLETMPFLGWAMREFKCIFVSPSRAKEAIRKASDALDGGEVVCIFPEGGLTRTGELQPLRSGFELIARRSQTPVIPVVLRGLWGSIFSFERGRFFWKWPRRIPYPVTITFGPALQSPDVESAEAAFRELEADS
jgi:acyl-[acyl-carrier-protein]-phospholipid O-acyltransferase/long-chain-fatty-acid--[acyl-carrier-protein] ligase